MSSDISVKAPAQARTDSGFRAFARYWLPPLVWMAIFFPVGNKALASSKVWQIFMAVLRWFAPKISSPAADLGYIIFRKSLHFLEYGILALLVYRAFRRGRSARWSLRWAVQSALISIGYGALDEFLQTFVPGRSGRAFDSMVDALGVIAALSLLALRSRRRQPGAARRPGWGRALFLKRPFDIALSGLGLLLSSPLWLAIAAAVKLQDGGPVFYGQERVGRRGRVFRALKFRSMVVDAEKGSGAVQATAHDPRVTPVGRILRGTAMDELPQLLSIFKGDMSFVGPRALRPNEKEVNGDPDTRDIQDIPGYAERHAVRPGLTGLTQIFLPGDTPRRKKFRTDLLYIRRQSFWLDLKLIFLSFWITFRGKWESREDKI